MIDMKKWFIYVEDIGGHFEYKIKYCLESDFIGHEIKFQVPNYSIARERAIRMNRNEIKKYLNLIDKLKSKKKSYYMQEAS